MQQPDTKKTSPVPAPAGPAYGRPADAFMAEQAEIVNARREHLHRALSLTPEHAMNLPQGTAIARNPMAAPARPNAVDLPEHALPRETKESPADAPKEYKLPRAPLEESEEA